MDGNIKVNNISGILDNLEGARKAGGTVAVAFVLSLASLYMVGTVLL